MSLEVHDIENAVVHGQRDPHLCSSIANCLRDTGCLVIRDPRVTAKDNDRFLNLMESYFALPPKRRASEIREELHYQVGLTPEGIEIPEAVHDPSSLDIDHLMPEDRPRMPNGPDPKCRYMWRIGQLPEKTIFKNLNSDPVIPPGFPEWSSVLNRWGEKLMATIETVCELLSIGLGLDDPLILKRMMNNGPHLLAPTGVDLSKHPKLDTPIAGYHKDLNLLTGHGKARYPGLFLWLRNGKRVPARIPDGCVLLQAGMQLERLTGALFLFAYQF